MPAPPASAATGGIETERRKSSLLREAERTSGDEWAEPNVAQTTRLCPHRRLGSAEMAAGAVRANAGLPCCPVPPDSNRRGIGVRSVSLVCGSREKGRQMRKLYLAVACAALVGLTGSAAAATPNATRYVSTSGTDTGDCITSPCRTIGYAVAQATAGDTVSVASGTYDESVTVTKQLSLVGSGATIDAAGFFNGIVISGAGAAGTVVR